MDIVDVLSVNINIKDFTDIPLLYKMDCTTLPYPRPHHLILNMSTNNAVTSTTISSPISPRAPSTQTHEQSRDHATTSHAQPPNRTTPNPAPARQPP